MSVPRDIRQRQERAAIRWLREWYKHEALKWRGSPAPTIASQKGRCYTDLYLAAERIWNHADWKKRGNKERVR